MMIDAFMPSCSQLNFLINSIFSQSIESMTGEKSANEFSFNKMMTSIIRHFVDFYYHPFFAKHEQAGCKSVILVTLKTTNIIVAVCNNCFNFRKAPEEGDPLKKYKIK